MLASNLHSAIALKVCLACLVLTQMWHWMIMRGHFGVAAIAASVKEHPSVWNSITHGGLVRAHPISAHACADR